MVSGVYSPEPHAEVYCLMLKFNISKLVFLSLLFHCDLSIEQVCFGTNMADSNHHQSRSHVGENLELAGNHSVKDSKRFLGYAHVIIRLLNHIEPFNWNIWNIFLTILSISAAKKSN